ncbi:hypothetical protein CR513_48965, partial [Mucuna pruriens]
MSNKKKLEGFEVVNLIEESFIVLKKLSLKLKDPWCFTIPYTMGFIFLEKHCESQPTNNSLKLVYKTIFHPLGIVKGVLVKVGEFISPTNFFMLNMEEEDEVPIILQER